MQPNKRLSIGTRSADGTIDWRRNLAVLVAVQILATLGFGLVAPFLPLYVRELGSSTGGSLEFWAGMAFSAQAFTMMLASPIWGALADRNGRKLMLERATLAGALLLAAMGFVQSSEQLVLLRALQGAVTGVVAANNALVAAQTPKEQTGFALGLINVARWVGVSAGPLVGGVLGELFGLRESFWITGGLLGLAGLAVILWVEEDFTPTERTRQPGLLARYQTIWRAWGMRDLYTLAFLRSLGATMPVPFLSLYVLALGTQNGTTMLAGATIGVSALTSALSAVYLGMLGDRSGHDRILLWSALLSALVSVPQMFVTATWQLVVLQAVSGLTLGGLIPSTAALMNRYAPEGNQGATYGLDNSVQAAGRVVAPLAAAGLAALLGYRSVFGGTALVYGAAAAVALAVLHTLPRQRVGAPAADPPL